MVYTTCKNGKLVGKCYIFLEPCSNKAGVAIALPSRHQPHRPWRRGYSCLWNTSGQPSQGSTYPFGGVENIGLTPIDHPKKIIQKWKLLHLCHMPWSILSNQFPTLQLSTAPNVHVAHLVTAKEPHARTGLRRWPRFLRPGIPLRLCQQFAIENGHWLIFVQLKMVIFQ